MNLYNIIQNILDTSKSHRLVKEVGEGDIYQYLNSGEHQYPCVFLTISSVNDTDINRNVNGTLFYVDRLTSDSSNKVSVQSLGITILGDILGAIEGDLDSVDYTVFTEKFTDLCGGVYANLNITYPFDELCGGDFEIRELEVTSNGVYDVLGYDKVVVAVVDRESLEKIEQLEGQIDTITTLSITENGIYTPEEGTLGWNNVEVDVEAKFVLDNGTKLAYSAWSEVPSKYDFSEITNFNYMFNYCSNITTISQIDTSNGTDFSYMFSNCIKLTTIPPLDTSNGTNFRSMFYATSIYNSNLTSIPQIDTSNGTDFGSMFYNCTKLTTIPPLDTSNGTSFYSMFYRCESLTTIPQLDTSKGTDFRYMFEWCRNLITIPQLDISKGTDFRDMFVICSNLENITFIGSINANIDFSPCTKLTYDSVKSILTACSNTTTANTKTLKFSRTLTDQNSELANLIATCTSKGWTISGLILN